VADTQVDLDPYAHDPTRWATSMVHHAELLLPCLDIASARSVVEVGAYAGDLTRLLVAWAATKGAAISAVDPSPRDRLLELAEERPELELIRETSLEALRHIPLPDAVIIDGDHNYYTVSEELRLIAERAEGESVDLPLLIFHDVAWPHGRRDDYFDAEAIPASHRHPVAGEGRGIVPGEQDARDGGLPYPRSAAQEGGPRNGVLTAIEDFVAERGGLRLATVPAFFGFGAVWRLDAPWAWDLAELLDPWDGNEYVRRLEENRVHHLAESHMRQAEVWRLQERQARMEAVLRRLIKSRAFAVAEQLSRLRVRARIAPAQSVVSKDEIRRALRD
jgi:SAM-dependent methyltransferase